jgi:hypothetical protein
MPWAMLADMLNLAALRFVEEPRKIETGCICRIVMRRFGRDRLLIKSSALPLRGIWDSIPWRCRAMEVRDPVSRTIYNE